MSSLMLSFWVLMLQRGWYVVLYKEKNPTTSTSGEEKIFPALNAELQHSSLTDRRKDYY